MLKISSFIVNMDLILHAKVEYTKQLQKLIRKGVYTTFIGLFEESKDGGENALKTFQTKLVGVPNWSQDIILLKYTEMISHISEELFEKLIQAIVISNVKIFGSIKKNKNAKIEVTLPDSKKFAHDIYIQCARSFYQRPGLFENRRGRISQSGISKNSYKISKVIDSCVEDTIRNVLPFNSILEEYFREDPDVLDNDDLNSEIDGMLADGNSGDESSSSSSSSESDNSEEPGIDEDVKEINLEEEKDSDDEEEKDIDDEEKDSDEEFFKD